MERNPQNDPKPQISEVPKRILIVRLSAIGDVILGVPVLCALRKAFPDTEIGWIVQGPGAQILKGHTDLNTLITIPKLSFRTPSKFLEAASQARSFSPDLTIDLQGLMKSSLLAYLSGAKHRVGFASGEYDGRECSYWLNNRLVTPKQEHMIHRGLELLQTLGVDNNTIEYRLPEHEADTFVAKKIVSDLFSDRPFAIINVGAGWVSKLWPNDRYAQVAQHLWRRWNLPSLVVWGGETERLRGLEIQSFAPEACKLAPSTSLTELRSLLRMSKLFIGSDTGPMHLSVAVDTPTIALIGPMPIERVGPLGEHHRAIQKERLPKELKSQRKTNMAPMLSIDSTTVCEACDAILAHTISFR
jgi:heptosyltransferase-1